MIEFGLHLRQARENRGLSLRQIAAATKISTVALEALEKGDFSRLPGGIFSRAFVRAYALEVGLEPDDTTRQFTELAEQYALTAAQTAPQSEISDDDRAFLERQRLAGVWLRIVVALLLVGLVALAAWWYVGRAKKAQPVAATDVPRVEGASDVAVTPAAETNADASSAPAAPAVVAPPKELAIKITAVESSWVSATAGGRQILSRTLAAGESVTVNSEADIALQFGNAGGVAWSINGRDARPLGASGENKRATVTRENFSEFLR